MGVCSCRRLPPSNPPNPVGDSSSAAAFSYRVSEMAALVASPWGPACCLQLRLLRRPPPAPPRLRFLQLSSARLRLCVASSPSDSFAGWSDRQQDDDADKSSGFGAGGGEVFLDSFIPSNFPFQLPHGHGMLYNLVLST